MNYNGYNITIADTAARYEGLRDLWCRTFGDLPELVDRVYETLSPDIFGCAAEDSGGRVVSSLTCYVCGSYADRPVYVIYAVCTDPEYRGRGIAGRLIEYAEDIIDGAGGISIVSPSEESLVGYYERLGFEPHFMVREAAAFEDGSDPFGFGGDDEEDWAEDEDDDFEAFEPGLSMVPVSTGMYNKYREAFLCDTPHISLSEPMLELIRAESCGGDGLFVINGGDAVCTLMTVYRDGYEQIMAVELLVNPMLTALSLEIDSEIAGRMARHLGMEMLMYRTPGYGRCQSMISELPEMTEYAEAGEALDPEEEMLFTGMPAYFGFPLE